MEKKERTEQAMGVGRITREESKVESNGSPELPDRQRHPTPPAALRGVCEGEGARGKRERETQGGGQKEERQEDRFKKARLV